MGEHCSAVSGARLIRILSRSPGAALAVALAAVALLAPLSVAQAAPAPESDERHTLRVAVLDLPPFGFLDSSGRPAGLTVECARAIAERLDMRAEHLLMPLRRAVDSLECGQADLCILFPSDMAQHAATNAGAILPLRTVVVGGPGTEFSLPGLQGRVLAHVRGADYDRRISEDPLILKNYTNDYAQGLKMLRAGYVDGVVGPELGIMHTARALGIGRRELGDPLVLSTAPGSVFVSRRSPHLEAVREAISELKEQGVFEALLAGYAL